MENDLGAALLAVIGSGHALLHHLTTEDDPNTTTKSRRTLMEAASRLVDLVSRPVERPEPLIRGVGLQRLMDCESCETDTIISTESA